MPQPANRKMTKPRLIRHLPGTVYMACLVAGSSANAAGPDVAFPGYSGFLNVPSSRVLEHGTMDVQYSNQGFIRGNYEYYDNVSGVMGIFPNVEISGRVIWENTHTNLFVDGKEVRDLSANAKLQIPFIPEDWFTASVGIQDIGGEVNFFDSTYAAVGREFGPFEITAGYGETDIEERYLSGAFGAVEYRPFDWGSVIAEYDSRNVRFGLGVTTPAKWLPGGVQLKGKVLLSDQGDDDNDRHFVSVGLSIPYGNAARKRRLLDETMPVSDSGAVESAKVAITQPANELARQSVELEVKGVEERELSVEQEAALVGKRLVQAGYERVKVGSKGDTLWVRWENNLYNRDERDSIHDVAQTVRRYAEVHRMARLQLLNQGIPVVERTLNLDADPGQDLAGGRFPQADFWQSEELPEWSYSGSFGPAWKPRLEIAPTITTGVATDYGVWDYSLGVASELSLSLWKGALVSATYNVEIDQSDDFEEGGAYYNNRQRTDLVEAEAQQTFKLHSLLYTSFHAGRYAFDYDGVLNETVLFAPNGRHSLGFLGGQFKHTETENVTEQGLARYSYYNPDMDVQFDIYGGQFFAEDTGVRVDTRFWFGDYAFTLTYKNTDAEFVGLGWVIPLTPVKDKQWRYLQIKGNPDWNYGVQTRISERNFISFGGAAILRSANPLQNLYMNRGRLPNR